MLTRLRRWWSVAPACPWPRTPAGCVGCHYAYLRVTHPGDAFRRMAEVLAEAERRLHP